MPDFYHVLIELSRGGSLSDRARRRNMSPVSFGVGRAGAALHPCTWQPRARVGPPFVFSEPRSLISSWSLIHQLVATILAGCMPLYSNLGCMRRRIDTFSMHKAANQLTAQYST